MEGNNFNKRIHSNIYDESFFPKKLFPQQSFIADVELGSKYISTCLEHNSSSLMYVYDIIPDNWKLQGGRS